MTATAVDYNDNDNDVDGNSHHGDDDDDECLWQVCMHTNFRFRLVLASTCKCVYGCVYICNTFEHGMSK